MSETRRGSAIDWAGLKERLARAAETLRGGAPSPAAARGELARRAALLAERPPPPLPDGTVRALVFELGGERYAIDAAAVVEVVRPPPLRRLPGAPPFLAGIVNHRGTVLDVLDVRGFLGAAAAPIDPRTRLVLLGAGAPELALLVDDVHALAHLDPTALAPAPDSPARLRPEYVRGLAPDGVALLDAAALLRDPRLVVDDAPAGPTPEVT